MKVRQLMYSMAAALCLSASANAATIIPTNFMGGADADLREHEMAATALAPKVVATTQRGNSNEIATSGVNAPDFDNTTTPPTPTMTNGDRSNLTMMKFNISTLPNHNSDPGFWANKELQFRTTVRNTSFTNARLQFPASGAPPTLYANFNIRGLEPNKFKNGVDASGGYRYVDDDPSDPLTDPANAINRLDRSNVAYTSPNYKYNWVEGTGTVGSGVSFVDAPGITPHCMLRGSCETATYANGDASQATNIFQSLGKFDDFNADTRFLANYRWPIGVNQYPGAARLPVGFPLDYTDTSGALKDLVFDAQDEGRSFVTLYLNLAIDVKNAANGGTSPNDMLNFSYALNPKEMITLTLDNAFDPNGSAPDTGVSLGSPWSCTFDAVARPNCTGQGNNTNGDFSPQLIIRVPEPTSCVMLALGAFLTGMVRRRK